MVSQSNHLPTIDPNTNPSFSPDDKSDLHYRAAPGSQSTTASGDLSEAAISVLQRDGGVNEKFSDNGHETTSKDSEDILPRDRQQKTPTYNYAYEKSMSHAEAKLFYQRHQRASRTAENESSQSPVLPCRSTTYIPRDDIPSRTASITSQTSNQSGVLPNSAQDTAANHPTLKTHVLDGPVPQGSSINAQNLPLNPRRYEESFLEADQSVKSHEVHSGLPNYRRPHVLTAEGVQGASAGIGIGQVARGSVSSEDAVTSELNVICRKIQSLLEKRYKYIRLSLQGPGDNPKDQPGWRIYPPPPEPVWDDEKEYSWAGGNPPNVGLPVESENATNSSPRVRKKRRLGQDIGEDFDMADLMPLPGESSFVFRLDGNSVYQVYETEEAAERNEPIVQIPSLRDFYMDLDMITEISTDGPIKTFAFKRLSYLEGKFQLYILLNEYQEIADSKKVPHRDFYNVRKVDTHVHHSACMNQKHLLRFIKSKMKKCPDEVVLYRDGKHLTLKEVFESINLTAYDLSIDTLDMHVSPRYF